jgi:hypothetical protein
MIKLELGGQLYLSFPFSEDSLVLANDSSSPTSRFEWVNDRNQKIKGDSNQGTLTEGEEGSVQLAS